MLTGKWADDWVEQGSQRWITERTVAIKVNHFRLICGYQPLWDDGGVHLDQYRRELEDQLKETKREEWLIIGDHNAQVGKWDGTEIRSEAVGIYGLGRRNDAGRDLVRWCEENRLVVVNSFYKHNWRGTWCHPARNTWHEIDGFIMKKDQMGRLVKGMKTIKEDSFSDHRPKMIEMRKVNLGQPPIRQKKRPNGPKINWEALQDERKRQMYDKTRERTTNLGTTEGREWEMIAGVMTKTALEVCGKKRKETATPWMAGREDRLMELRRKVSEAVENVREKKERNREDDNDETRRELEEAINQRKRARKERRDIIASWENEYWERIIETMKEAQDKGNMGDMYRIMKQLGQRGTSKATPSTCFTPEEFKEHFEKVSQHEFENDRDRWNLTLDRILDKRHTPTARRESRRLEETPTREEIEKAIKGMKDKAPGEDDVRLTYIKHAAEETKRRVIKIIQDLFETEPDEWEESLESGLVIPLFKKGDRKDRNNYRGVCLLSMGSRILARVLATRIREWTERLDLVDDNQNGFRTGRSTMDATQIVIRIQEEAMEREQERKDRNEPEIDRPEDEGAVLLDITKAYPRVNRPAMWRILELAGMGPKCLRTVKGIHEKTTYKIKGREECSTAWKASRGLREGCATSPALFNLYHAEVMRQAKQKREDECQTRNLAMGIEWMHVPGSSFPPKSKKKARGSSDAENFRVSETLFADDTTLLGTREELQNSTPGIKESMRDFEEKCHDGKEEWVFFGKKGSENVRMLGTWLGRDKDVKERLNRGNRAWWTIKKRLLKTRISKRTQVRIIEACVESTILFDCAARPWMVREIKALQRMVDRCYRYVWMDKKGGPALIQMERKKVNMFDIRDTLGTGSIENKIAKRTMERIGHVIRMEDHRMTKTVTLGWNSKAGQHRGNSRRKNNTISFWRSLLKKAGVDADTVESEAKNRIKWKKICKRDAKRRHEEDKGKRKQKPEVDERQNRNEDRDDGENVCNWEGCDKRCATKSGLVQHQRLAHKRTEYKFRCDKCTRTFKQQSNLTNHRRTCRGTGNEGQCQWCHREMRPTNLARHEGRCPQRGRRREDEGDLRNGSEDEEPGENGTRRERPRWPCCFCGENVKKGGIQCMEIGLWCHFKCSGISYQTAKKWSREELGLWKCPKHV